MKLFVFTEGEKCGLMDSTGATVLEAKYEQLGRSSDEIVAFAEGNRWGLIDIKGSVIHPPAFTKVLEMEDGPVIVRQGILHGVLRRDGSVSCECRFAELGAFSGGLAPAQVDWGAKYGFVDCEGHFVIEARFESAEPFSEGRAAVRDSEDRYGFIDSDGATRVPFKNSLVHRFSEGLAAFSKVKAANRFGFLGPEGEEVLKPQWNGADLRFSEGLACVWKGEKHGYIDRLGNLIIGFQHEVAEPFSCGLALCGTERRGKYCLGFIDRRGEWAIEPGFTEGNSFEGGLAMVSDGNHEGYINTSGDWVRRWAAN